MPDTPDPDKCIGVFARGAGGDLKQATDRIEALAAEDKYQAELARSIKTLRKCHTALGAVIQRLEDAT